MSTMFSDWVRNATDEDWAEMRAFARTVMPVPSTVTFDSPYGTIDHLHPIEREEIIRDLCEALEMRIRDNGIETVDAYELGVYVVHANGNLAWAEALLVTALTARDMVAAFGEMAIGDEELVAAADRIMAFGEMAFRMDETGGEDGEEREEKGEGEGEGGEGAEEGEVATAARPIDLR